MIRLLLGILLTSLLWPTDVAAQSEEVIYYHTDAVGSVRATTDANGAVLARYDFLPFGEAWQPPPTPDVRQFAGKERDSETGLDYFGARYYASGTGRFTTVDPVLDAETALTNPQRWNRYSYALNRPLTHVDPDGRSPKAVVLALKVGHALYKGYDVYSTVEALVDAGGTLVSPESTGWERLLAAGTLAGELSGVSDGLRAGRGVLRAVDDVRDAGRGVADLNRLASRAKEVPDSQIGPSGKPKIHVKEHATRKRAEDAAQDRSRRGVSPEEHSNPRVGDPHFHPSGSNSREHHTYPRKGVPRK